MGVCVGSAVKVRVAEGGTGVFVGSAVAVSVCVLVGGTGVLLGVCVGVRVDGIGVSVEVTVAVNV
jgi:hypothetical protein